MIGIIINTLRAATIMYGEDALMDSANTPPMKGPIVIPMPKKASVKPIIIPTLPLEVIFETVERVKGENIPIVEPIKAINIIKNSRLVRYAIPVRDIAWIIKARDMAFLIPIFEIFSDCRNTKVLETPNTANRTPI